MSYYEIRSETFEAVFNGYMLKYPPHFHSDAEILYVISGEFEINIDGRDYVLTSGKAALIFPNTIHSFKSDYNQNMNYKIFMCLCSADLCGEYMNILTTMKTDNPVIYVEDFNKEIDFCAEHIVSAYNNNDKEAAGCMIPFLVMNLLRHMDISENTNKIESDAPHKIAVYITQHFTENISLSVLSEQLHMSRLYISHVISKNLATSLPSYINSLRTARSAQLLMNTDHSISEICYECGFENERTFRRAFLKYYGVSAHEFRCGMNKQQ